MLVYTFVKLARSRANPFLRFADFMFSVENVGFLMS